MTPSFKLKLKELESQTDALLAEAGRRTVAVSSAELQANGIALLAATIALGGLMLAEALERQTAGLS